MKKPGPRKRPNPNAGGFLAMNERERLFTQAREIWASFHAVHGDIANYRKAFKELVWKTQNKENRDASLKDMSEWTALRNFSNEIEDLGRRLDTMQQMLIEKGFIEEGEY